jgi:hypothetical protein
MAFSPLLSFSMTSAPSETRLDKTISGISIP